MSTLNPTKNSQIIKTEDRASLNDSRNGSVREYFKEK